MNEAVSYILVFDTLGRPQAKKVRFNVNPRSASLTYQVPRARIALPITFAMIFLVALTVFVVGGWLDKSWLALYYGASIIAYGVYAWDKTAAQNARGRVPESTLHLMSLLGGWPGALIAQALLRHKTRKPSFLIRYWFTVIVNCVALGVLIGKGVSPLKVLLGTAA